MTTIENFEICYFKSCHVTKLSHRNFYRKWWWGSIFSTRGKYFWHVWWKWNLSSLIIMFFFYIFIFSHKNVARVQGSIDLFEKHNSGKLNRCVNKYRTYKGCAQKYCSVLSDKFNNNMNNNQQNKMVTSFNVGGQAT